MPTPPNPPSESEPQVEVVLLGGPDDWHETTLRVPASDLHDIDLAGVMLISDHTPPRDEGLEDIDPRAVYDPDPEPAPPNVWWFRGWFPAAVGRPEWRRPSPADREPAEVDLDTHGCPVSWTLPSGEQWTVDRLQVHWLFDGEGAAGDDTGVWQLRAHTAHELIGGWELVHDPAVGWAAGRIPAPGPQ